MALKRSSNQRRQGLQQNEIQILPLLWVFQTTPQTHCSYVVYYRIFHVFKSREVHKISFGKVSVEWNWFCKQMRPSSSASKFLWWHLFSTLELSLSAQTKVWKSICVCAGNVHWPLTLHHAFASVAFLNFASRLETKVGKIPGHHQPNSSTAWFVVTLLRANEPLHGRWEKQPTIGGA